jgi:purine-binding chemotaxis protein CheW
MDGMPNLDNHTQLVVVSLGGDEYGLPMAHVQEIVRYTDPVRGAISVRGKTVPVCDLAARLGVAADAAKIVIGADMAAVA